MENEEKKGSCCGQSNCENKPPRRRGLTSLTLQWIAEKFRKAEQIKGRLESGTYTIETDKVAKAILTGDVEKEGVK